MIDKIIAFDFKNARLGPSIKGTVERLSALGKKAEAEPDTHKFLLAMTASSDLSKFDWVIAGKPSLLTLLGLMEIIKSQVHNIYEEAQDET